MSDDRRLKTEPGAEGDRPLLLREIEFAWRPGRVWFLLLAFLLVASVLVSFSSGHFLKRGWDGYSYLATIRSLGEIEEDPGRYANPAYVIVGAFYRQLDTDPLNLLAVLAVINALVFLWAAYLFFSLHFRRETVFYILFAMLFFWGRLRWSGAYSFVDTYDYFYPQGIAYSFLLLSFYFLYRSSNGERRFLALPHCY